MDNLELTAPGLLLRPWRIEDAPEVLAALSDPAIDQWNPQGVARSTTQAALLWVGCRADWSAGAQSPWRSPTPATGRCWASVSLHHILHGNATIGYWTIAAARGRGIASTAVAALTAWGFGTSGYTASNSATRSPTPPPAASPTGPATVAEGTLRESHRYGDGRRHDEHLHARLATDT